MLGRRTGLLTGPFAEQDKREGVPRGGGPKLSIGVAGNYVFGLLKQRLEHGMSSRMTEPISGISGIRLLAMKDAMPKATLRSVKILRGAMAFFET